MYSKFSTSRLTPYLPNNDLPVVARGGAAEELSGEGDRQGRVSRKVANARR